MKTIAFAALAGRGYRQACTALGKISIHFDRKTVGKLFQGTQSISARHTVPWVRVVSRSRVDKEEEDGDNHQVRKATRLDLSSVAAIAR